MCELGLLCSRRELRVLLYWHWFNCYWVLGEHYKNACTERYREQFGRYWWEYLHWPGQDGYDWINQRYVTYVGRLASKVRRRNELNVDGKLVVFTWWKQLFSYACVHKRYALQVTLVYGRRNCLNKLVTCYTWRKLYGTLVSLVSCCLLSIILVVIRSV